jgi:hypothetical protein
VSDVLDRMVDVLVRGAVRRWPVDARDDLTREWTAELHALAIEPGVSAPVRAWRRLRFAGSLAASGPRDADAIGVRGPGRASAERSHATWLVFAPLLTMLITPVLLVPVQLPMYWLELTPTVTAVFVVENYLAVAGVAALVGTLLARRLLRRRGGGAVGAAACAWWSLPVVAGLLVVDGLARGVNQAWAGGWATIVVAFAVAIPLPSVAAGVAALARRGRRWLAVLLAGLAAPTLTFAGLFVAAWLDMPPSADGRPWWWLSRLGREPMLPSWYDRIDGGSPTDALLTVLPGFLLATVVLALAHAIRLARPLPSTVVAAEPGSARAADVDVPAVARSPWWHRAALAGAAYSVVAWAVTLAYLTPNIGVQSSWPARVGADGLVSPAPPAGWPGWTTEEGRLWMHELQVFAIVCAALCLLCAAAYRGRPLGPTLAASAVLLATTMTVVRTGWTAPRLLPWLAAGGLLLGMAAWAAATRWATRSRRPGNPYRLVVTVAVLAAFLVPGSFLPRAYVVRGVQAPPVLLLVAVGLPTVLTVIAAMGVLATSRRSWPGPAWRLPAALAALPAIGGVIYFQDAVPFPSGTNPLTLLTLVVPLALATPAAALTIAAIRGRVDGPRRSQLIPLLGPLVFVGGIVAAVASLIAANVIARLVLFPMEYAQTYDGLAYVPGAVVVGLLIAHLAAIALDRRGVPVSVSAPADVTR